MWRQEKKDNSIVSLALLLALATIPTTATLLVPAPMLAQSATDAPAFSLPQSVENGTIVRIDGADSLAAINQGLKQSFEKQFSGAKVEVAASGTDAALRAMLDGKVDLVALSRGLTPEEKAEGLEQVRLRREKIAIAVGAENPFKGSLTNKQFVKIFRGEITDWSQLGAPKGKIRIIDRPTTSDTRNNFRNYPAFKNANFATSSNATQVGEDNTAEIVKQLGKDGISYGLADHLSKLPDVRLISVNQISPNNPKYPFSQPLVYVYKKNPSPAIASFLGFAIASPGQQAIDEARNTEAQAIAEGKSPVLAIAATPTAEATTLRTVAPTEQPVTTPVKNNSGAATIPAILLLSLLPLIGGLFIWWFLNRRSSTNEEPDNEPEPEPTLNPSSVDESSNLDGAQSTNSNLDAGTILTTSNTVDNITSTENAAIAGDVPLDTGVNTQITANPINHRDSAAAFTPESDQTAWDIEAPAAVVNTSYPQLPDVPLVASDVKLPTSQVSPSVPEAIELPEVASDTDIWNSEPTPEPQKQQPLPGLNTNYGGAALAAGAAIWAANSGTDLDIQANDETVQDSNIPELNSPELSEISPVEPELPEIATDSWFAAAEFPEVTTDAALPTAEIPPVEPELPEIATDSWFAAAEFPEVTTDAALPTAEIPPVEPELPEITTDSGFAVAEFPELPEVELNAVADAAELTANLGEEDTVEIISDLPETTTEATSNVPEALAGGAALAAGAGIGAWATIYGIHNDASESNAQAEITPVASATVVITPQSSNSAEVSWHILDTQKQALQNSGVSQLALRLYDVTGIDLSYQVPHLVQQYELESAAHDRFVDIPTSDHDYITEIGYVAEGDYWVSIARSASVRVFSPLPVDEQTADSPEENIAASIVLKPQTANWAYVSWHIPDSQKAALQYSDVSQLALRLYDVTGIDLSYQVPHLVQQYELESAAHDRFVDIPTSDRDYITEIGYVAEGDHWVSIARSASVRVFSPLPVDEQTADDIEPSVVLTPQSSQLAEVSWHIPDTQKQALQNSGASQFALRLYDVTGIDLSYQVPHLVQQYELEAAAQDISLDIPTSDHDYITEIGYVTAGDRWESIARSASVRVFSPLPVDEQTADSPEENIAASVVITSRTPKWAYVSWHIPDTQKAALQSSGVSQLALRLYDVTARDLSYQLPQLVQQYELESVAHDIFVTIPASDRDYITEIGYVAAGEHWVSIARSASVRVFSRPHTDFWFVADAELIIHGATQPDAAVSIGGNAIKLKPDGTFHLRIPFSDSLIEYLLTATAVDGEKARTIHKKFSQETPEP